MLRVTKYSKLPLGNSESVLASDLHRYTLLEAVPPVPGSLLGETKMTSKSRGNHYSPEVPKYTSQKKTRLKSYGGRQRVNRTRTKLSHRIVRQRVLYKRSHWLIPRLPVTRD